MESSDIAGARAPIILLARPQMGENIGAVARAMLNCGLTALRLIAPRDGWPNPAAWPMAAGADAILEAATVYEDTPAACADLHRVYATTARPRDMPKPVLDPRDAATSRRRAAAEGARCGLLFGAERSGLDNDEVAAADAVVTAPLNPDFSSLNIAQAVLLAAWEWRMADPPPPAAPIPRARHAEMAGLFAHLEGALDARGFFKSREKKPRMIRNLRALLQRADLSEQEVRTLRGVVACLTDRRPPD